MEFHGSLPYTEIHGDLIPKEYFLSGVCDSWNIPPTDNSELQEIINEMGELNATDELALLICLLRRLGYTFRGLPSAKSFKGMKFEHILCEQYVSRLTINQRIEKVKELANKIEIQRFYDS
ncbi:MAG: hypothetical protein RMX63_34530 [Aulosira sp. ZfuCHP01]|nr:hypothetical protein [Aulosira sp. ZfuVER01]MDZ8002349.1 hypothetical protein [Aulosira sp. DedVER01a]MDZ8056543.1 hypothetical protein [Aulosira sp. ZfuCHP01]